MAQADIIKLLKKKRGFWLSCKEIVLALGARNNHTIGQNLTRLRKTRFVSARLKNSNEWEYTYGVKEVVR